MSNPTQSQDPAPAQSAAELRRRLLAAPPPQPVGTANNTETTSETSGAEKENDEAPVTPTAGSATDLLARLRMPGKSGPIPVPTPRPSTPPTIPDATPVRPPVTRRIPSNSAVNGSLGNLAALSVDDDLDDHNQSEIRRVRLENKDLRKLLHEMKQLLQEASENEKQWQEKEKTYESTLAEKGKQIEVLSAQLGAIEEQIAKGELAPPPPIPKTRTELEEWSDDLEKENAKLQQDKKRLEEERRQLHEDEEALEKQMREMEVSMARERALLARQETELRRLSAEIQHELELMQRGDATLREQMAKFQRRAQEVLAKPPGGQNNRR